MNKKHHRERAKRGGNPFVVTDTASSEIGLPLYSWFRCPNTSSAETLGGSVIFRPIKHHTVNILSALEVQNETPELNYFFLFFADLLRAVLLW